MSRGGSRLLPRRIRMMSKLLIDFVSCLFIQYVPVFIKLIRACGNTHLEGIFFDFLSLTDKFGNYCVPVRTAIGLSPSFDVTFVSFLISIYQIDKHWK